MPEPRLPEAPQAARVTLGLPRDLRFLLWDSFVVWDLAPGLALAALPQRGVA